MISVEPHPLTGLRWWVARHVALVAALTVLAGVVGLHYLP